MRACGLYTASVNIFLEMMHHVLQFNNETFYLILFLFSLKSQGRLLLSFDDLCYKLNNLKSKLGST